MTIMCKKKRKIKKEVAVCAVFALTLYGMWMACLLHEERLYSEWEKRMLAQKPEWELDAVLDGSYESAYEEWITDQFPMRDWWVGVKTRCEIFSGKKEINGIYLGKDGYLFSDQVRTADWDSLEIRMTEQYGEEKVSRIHVPAAGSVLEENLPYPLSFPAEKDTVWENLYNHREEYIYYRTDHHWTMLGAYYGYEAWAEDQKMEPVSLSELRKESVKEDFLGTHYGRLHYAEQSDVIELYDPGVECRVVYDLGESDLSGLYQPGRLSSGDAYRFFLDGNHAAVQIDTGRGEGHLAVLKDSFANCLIPFLTIHYQKITVVDPRYFRADPVAWLQDQGVTEVLILAQDTISADYMDTVSADETAVEKEGILCYSETGGCTDEVEEDRVHVSGSTDMGFRYFRIGFKY